MHLTQFPLKCCAFPGAETARKQFLLRGASTPAKKLPRTRRTRRRIRLKLERAAALTSFPGFFDSLNAPQPERAMCTMKSVNGMPAQASGAMVWPFPDAPARGRLGRSNLARFAAARTFRPPAVAQPSRLSASRQCCTGHRSFTPRSPRLPPHPPAAASRPARTARASARPAKP